MYASTRMQQVYRAVLTVGDGSFDGLTEIDDAYETVIQGWLDGVCRAITGSSVDNVAGSWADENTWVTNLPNFTFTSIDNDDRRALRVVYRDVVMDVNWAYNVGFYLSESGRVNLDVQTYCSSERAGEDVKRSVPACLLTLLARGQVIDIEPLRDRARAIDTREQVQDLVRTICDLDRRLPVIVVSDPPAIDADVLARELFGVAHVCTIGAETSFALSDMVGKAWSAYGGAIRTYRVPFLPDHQDRFAHPLALLSSITQRGAGAFMASFIDRVYRNTIADADRFPHFDVLALRQALLEERLHRAPVVVETKEPQPPPVTEAPREERPEREELARPVASEHELLATALAEERSRVSELELQVTRLQTIGEQAENDYYAVLAEFEDYRRLHREDAVSFAALLQAAEYLPGSADVPALVTGLQGLVAGIYGAIQDMRSTAAENTDLRERLFATQLKLSASRDAPGGYATPRARPDDLRPSSVRMYVEQNFADRLILHPRTDDSLKNTPFANPQGVYDALDLLAGEYRDMRLRGESDTGAYGCFQDRLRELGLTYSDSISPSELSKYYPFYHVQYDGAERFLEKHLRNGGNTADPKRCFRIYFFFDEMRKAVIVGSLPGHLPNSLT